MDLNRLQTYSLKGFPNRASVIRIISAALRAVDPEIAVRKSLVRVGDTLAIRNQTYSLKAYKRIRIIGCGKAAYPMATACAEILGGDLDDGIIIVKDKHIRTKKGLDRLAVFEAGHPIPDDRGVQATKLIMDLTRKSSPDDLVICLFSGGGSSLFTAPVEGITLDNLQVLTDRLLSCGASINEINTMRKHLDLVKGGRLAAMIYPAKLLCLILSDVVGDPLDVIASGPTCPDQTSYEGAWSILEKYHLIDQIPSAIQEILSQGREGRIPETPKPNDPVFEKVQNVLIGSNLVAAQAALNQARLEDLNSIILTTTLQGEARAVGPLLAGITRQISNHNQPVDTPACVILGGETTVKRIGKGSGGRNQELALSMVEEIADIPETLIITLATDGGDGSTDAAGATITGETYLRAYHAGLDPSDYLDRNDSYHFFDPLDDLIRIGPTLTNVNDLIFMFILKSKGNKHK